MKVIDQKELNKLRKITSLFIEETNTININGLGFVKDLKIRNDIKFWREVMICNLPLLQRLEIDKETKKRISLENVCPTFSYCVFD